MVKLSEKSEKSLFNNSFKKFQHKNPSSSEDLKLQDISLRAKVPSEECIIVVGSTGTGKSSTISKCTKIPIESGAGHQSVTKFPSVYKSKDPDGVGSVYWVDTVGWDDLNGDDYETFQEILQLINRHNVCLVRAIIWTVQPGSIRQDATLQKQANLINLFLEKDIWNNVIIVCKQAVKPDTEGAGALKTAYEFHKSAKVQLIGYRYIDDPAFDDGSKSMFLKDPKVREQLNVVDDDEVKNIVFEAMSKIGKPVQIIFNNYQCSACGVEGDKRLLPQYCHMEKQYVHPSGMSRYHPCNSELYHPAANKVSEHPGRLRANFFQSTKLCCIFGGGKGQMRYKCCKKFPDEVGCMEKWACCRMDLNITGCQKRYACCSVNIDEGRNKGCEYRYECCKKDSQSTGCEEICKKCEKPWGSAALRCFKCPHVLEELL